MEWMNNMFMVWENSDVMGIKDCFTGTPQAESLANLWSSRDSVGDYVGPFCRAVKDIFSRRMGQGSAMGENNMCTYLNVTTRKGWAYKFDTM